MHFVAFGLTLASLQSSWLGTLITQVPQQEFEQLAGHACAIASSVGMTLHCLFRDHFVIALIHECFSVLTFCAPPVGLYRLFAVIDLTHTRVE